MGCVSTCTPIPLAARTSWASCSLWAQLHQHGSRAREKRAQGPFGQGLSMLCHAVRHFWLAALRWNLLQPPHVLRRHACSAFLIEHRCARALQYSWLQWI